MNNENHDFKYKWATWGDLNAFFGLMLDNVTNLVILNGILVFGFGYPVDYVFTKMIPGTAFGVFIGDLIYTWMAIKLAQKTKNPNVTAMPLGLDTPSTIGMAVAVMGPTFIATGKNPEITWYVGMSVMIVMGIIKLIMSFIGQFIQKVVPQAGLLGSLAGIGLALLGFLPLIDTFKMPIVGLISLGIILYTIVAKLKLPGNIPGVFAAVFIGTVIYYILGNFNLLGEGIHFKTPDIKLQFALPLPNLGFLYGMKDAIPYLPIAIPFGLLTIVGGINVTESAKAAGDDFKTRDILLVEAFATIAAGLCGGVAQSTPYIGHPAYKAMGARAGYTLGTGLFIGIGGILGYVSFIVDLIPTAAVAPILIFVGLEIITQAFHVCPKKHTPAVAFSFLPIISDLVLIEFGKLMNVLGKTTTDLTGEMLLEFNIINALGHGFILTAMLWGAILSFIIDKDLKNAFLYLIITSLFTFFGIIHSVKPNGDIYLPWLTGSTIPYYFTIAYLTLALFLSILNHFNKNSTTEK